MSNKNTTIGQRPASTPVIWPVLEASNDSFRTLLAHVNCNSQQGTPARVLFLGATVGCGNTTVAACAAITLARDSMHPVRIVEADVYQPALAGYLEVEARPGLIEVATGQADLSTAVQASPFARLSVVTAGGAGDLPQGALGDSTIHGVIEDAMDDREIVVIDGPALLEHPDACSLARHATDVVLVARAGHTSRQEIQAVLEILAAGQTVPIGVFLNRT